MQQESKVDRLRREYQTHKQKLIDIINKGEPLYYPDYDTYNFYPALIAEALKEEMAALRIQEWAENAEGNFEEKIS